MAQNWTSIVKSNWVFSKFYLLIYIYIYIYGWVQVTLGVTLSNVTSLNIF